jgi:uncharacterized protein involved in copper resistance
MSSAEENITTETAPETPVKPAEQPRINLADIKITDQNMALNLLVGFLNIAQRRGAFGMDESAKVWEAVKWFVVPAEQSGAPMPPVPEGDGEIEVSKE